MLMMLALRPARLEVRGPAADAHDARFGVTGLAAQVRGLAADAQDAGLRPA